ncbi:MAG TPA: proprotein convertase P-domain-containing protein [Paucimonas sp.]|nr:proprotein convertase P-domain-containing protein [Paucimonas sp.]
MFRSTGMTAAAFLLLTGFATGHAAEPLFVETGAEIQAQGTPAAGSVSPFAGDRKVLATRAGMRLNPAATAAAELTLALPDGRRLDARRINRYTTAGGSTVWIGKHGAAPQGTHESAGEETVLVVRAGRVMGTIRHDGKLYRIRSAADGSHAIAELDADRFPPDHVESEYRQQPLQAQVKADWQPATNAASREIAEFDRQRMQSAGTDGTGGMVTATPPVIRVLVNYTPAAKNAAGDIDALIDLAIAETNQGYVNANVNARVELAHKALVNYTESGSNSTDRSRYADVDDRVMDEIHAQRNTYAADVGVLLTEGNSGCGNGSIHASATSAFATVTADCATGNYSFGHELGHLYGARHNPEEDSTTTPYAYGHGYLSPDRKWRTIMAYNCSSGCPRLNYWSNPSKIYSDGQAMGTATKSNNARVLNERAATLAGFRPPPATGVVAGNTADYAIPDNNTSGVSSPVSIATPGNAGTVTVDVNIVHPYIGDLVVDLIAPDNTVYNLHNRSGGSADNIVTSYSVSVGAKSRVGTWKLRASDRAAQDVGHIESWTFKSP